MSHWVESKQTCSSIMYSVHGTVGCSKIAIILMIFYWICIFSNIRYKKDKLYENTYQKMYFESRILKFKIQQKVLNKKDA